MTLPAELTDILPDETARAWEHIAPILPPSCRLAGGTALAVHLRHRQSRDLDFFYNDPDLDLTTLEQRLSRLGSFAVSSRAPGTLDGILHGAKLQFLAAHDVDDDHMLPERHATIAAYWKRRQPEVSRSLARFPSA